MQRSRPGQPISPGSLQNRDPWGHWTWFVSPGGRPGHVGHWSRFIWTFWSRLVGRTGTNGPRSWPTIIGLGWWDEPGPMGLAPGPPPLVPVGGLNRDQRLPFSPGSCHQPGPMRCLYIPPRARAELSALFFLAEGERALWCSSSPPMHMRCSMECPSHTT